MKLFTKLTFASMLVVITSNPCLPKDADAAVPPPLAKDAAPAQPTPPAAKASDATAGAPVVAPAAKFASLSVETSVAVTNKPAPTAAPHSGKTSARAAKEQAKEKQTAKPKVELAAVKNFRTVSALDDRPADADDNWAPIDPKLLNELE